MPEPILSSIVIGLIVNAAYDLLKWAHNPNDPMALEEKERQLPPYIPSVLAAVSGTIDDVLGDSNLTPAVRSHVDRFIPSQPSRSLVQRLVAIAVLDEGPPYTDQLRLELQTTLRIDYPGPADQAILLSDELFDRYLNHVASCVSHIRAASPTPTTLGPDAQLDLIRRHLAAIDRNTELLSRPIVEIDAFVAYEDRLRRQISQRNELMTPPQLEGASRVPIDALFVAPRLTHGLRKPNDVERMVTMHGLLDEASHVVVLGDPGGGKTTLAQKLTYDLASDGAHTTPSQRRATPVLVPLRDYGAQLRRSQLSILAFLEQMSASVYQVEPPAGALEFLLLNGRVTVIFDGLDELLDTSFRQTVTGNVESFCTLFPAVPIIVTSRRVGYEEAPLDTRLFSSFALAPFDREQVAAYVHRWFDVDTVLAVHERRRLADAFIEESAFVEDLRSNPLMLALMCSIYRGEGYIPRQRPDVYEKCATMLFDRWDRRRELRERLAVEAHVDPLMRHLARWLYTSDDIGLGATETALVAVVTEYLLEWRFRDRQESLVAAEQFVRFCRGRAWVFTDVGTTPDGEALYHFTHRTFLEFFTAADLVREAETPERLFEELLPHIAQAEWDVVAQLAVQIQSKQTAGAAETLLREVVEASKVSAHKERDNLLVFGARCLGFLVPRPAVVSDFTKTCLDLLFAVDEDDAKLRTTRSEEFPYETSKSYYHFLLLAREENLPIIAEEFTSRLTAALAATSEQRQVAMALDALLTVSSAARTPHFYNPDEATGPYWERVSRTIMEEQPGFEGLAIRFPWAANLAMWKGLVEPAVVLDAHGLSTIYRRNNTPYSRYGFVSSVAIAIVELVQAGSRSTTPWSVALALEFAARVMAGAEPEAASEQGDDLPLSLDPGREGFTRPIATTHPPDLVGAGALMIAADSGSFRIYDTSMKRGPTSEAGRPSSASLDAYCLALGLPKEPWRDALLRYGVREEVVLRCQELLGRPGKPGGANSGAPKR